MGKSAREVMSGGADCIGEKETIEAAARKLADFDVGAMPICGEDDRLKGMLTDRDIVVKVIAKGKDPAQTTAGELATQGEMVTIGADDSVDEAAGHEDREEGAPPAGHRTQHARRRRPQRNIRTDARLGASTIG